MLSLSFPLRLPLRSLRLGGLSLYGFLPPSRRGKRSKLRHYRFAKSHLGIVLV